MKEPLAWYLITGAVLVIMAITGSHLKRLPVSTAIIYLAIGFALGPYGLKMVDLDFQREARTLELLTEIAVIISLFTAGLKLRAPILSKVWMPALILATLGMVITVGLVALLGNWVYNFTAGGAILLGAIMSPTDPVLASDVQTRHPYDQDRLRFTLTAEAGLNDGTAFPFVMLGLGLLGVHHLGGGVRWALVDFLYATAVGLAIGAALGYLIGRFILHLRREHQEAIGLDDFLALGLIALSYGAALYIDAYGFLAVFAAGLALRHVEQKSSEAAAATATQAATEVRASESGEKFDRVDNPIDDLVAADEKAVTDPVKAPAYMARAVLQFNESLERIAEVAVVVAVGCLLDLSMLTWETVGFAFILMLVIRPLAVAISLIKSGVSRERLLLLGWFGVRGIGSLYYLAYALTHQIREDEGRRLIDFALIAVVVSVLVHGTTVTPLMSWYSRKRESKALAT